jgi:hypothetical protein
MTPGARMEKRTIEEIIGPEDLRPGRTPRSALR